MRHNGEGWGLCSGFEQGGIHNVFFIGEFSQNPSLKNVISTNIKDFSWKNSRNSPNFEKNFFFQIARFLH
jgi:hypothetical protein